MFNKFVISIFIFIMIISNSSNPQSVKDRLDMYKSVTLTADLSWLSPNEKKIIPILIEAAKYMDDIFWFQAYGFKDELMGRIDKLYPNDPVEAGYIKKLALINYGPWERLDGNKPFVEGFGNKPDCVSFYPPDMTKEEFEKFDNKDKKSQYTVLKRNNIGELKVVPYSVLHMSALDKAANLLKEAAGLAEDAGLKNYLLLRADALLNDNYQPSDFAWMEMKKSNIDFVVGPIENYEDKLFGYKASFESFVLVKDPEWSKKLEKFNAMLPGLQKGLPVDENYKKEIPATESDMNVYNVLYYAGDANAGGKTIAINLPNDEEVQLKKGSRRLQLKNAMQAKFESIMLPISDLLISKNQRKYVKFDAFFENVTFHEVAHGLGIKNTIDGKTTVRDAIKEYYGALEEGKADILGLYLVTKLYEMGELKSGEVMDNYVTFLAGIFRSCRFGAADAHGKANMVRFYYFEREGAFTRHNDGTYSVNFEKMQKAIIGSVQQILKIQGDGDYNAAKELIDKDGSIKPELQKDLDRINSEKIPIDIIFEQGMNVLKF
jgi:hypothetical protein